MFFTLFICFVFGEQAVPLVPSTDDILRPWVGAFHPNGSVPIGQSSWIVDLHSSEFPDWIFDSENDTGLVMQVVQTCDFNMTFEVQKKSKHSETEWSQVMNSTSRGSVTYCDLDRDEYHLVVINSGSMACDKVEMEVYIGLGQGVCIFESLAKSILRIFLIVLFIFLGICLCGIVLAVVCGVTACCVCCKKKKPHYARMQNQQNNVPAPGPAYNQQNYAPQNNAPYNPAYVQQQAPQTYNQPVYNQGYVQPNHTYAQPQQPYQPAYPTQPNTGTGPHTEHV